MRGTWRGQIGAHTEFADTLEELLMLLAPDAPEEYLWHAAEVLGDILGAVAVNRYGNEAELNELLIQEALNAVHAEFFGGFADEPEHWHPTEPQQAYFENERTDDAEHFDATELLEDE
jgi:hypothetical protein